VSRPAACNSGKRAGKFCDSLNGLNKLVSLRVTLNIPDSLAKKFFSTTSARRRSSTVARLLRAELRRQELTASCSICKEAGNHTVQPVQIGELLSAEHHVKNPATDFGQAQTGYWRRFPISTLNDSDLHWIKIGSRTSTYTTSPAFALQEVVQTVARLRQSAVNTSFDSQPFCV